MGKRIYSKFLRDFSVKVNALINIGYKDVKEREEEGFDRRHMGEKGCIVGTDSVCPHFNYSPPYPWINIEKNPLPLYNLIPPFCRSGPPPLNPVNF